MSKENRKSAKPQSSLYYNPVKIFHGRGCRAEAVPLLLGKRILVVTTERGKKQFQDDPVLGKLSEESLISWVDGITQNPELQDIQKEINKIHLNSEFDFVVGFGGGSAMDASKAINLAISIPEEIRDLRELIARPDLHGLAPRTKQLMFPTTSGTGSEVTPFATIWDGLKKSKLSLASEYLFPNSAYVDPDLTSSLPFDSTLNTSLDALNQAMESIWNKRATTFSLAMATRSVLLGVQGMRCLAEGNLDMTTRELLSEASVLAGLAISQTRTALCHSISYPMTTHFNVPHGLACAFTMKAVMENNLLKEDGRFANLSLQLTGRHDENALLEVFTEILDSLMVNQRVKDQIPDLKSLLDLKAEMISPDRSQNNLNSDFSLDEIIEKSWNGV